MVKPHDEPAKVGLEHGEVLIDGPDGLTGSMTPEAALATAKLLGDKAVEAIVERAGDDAEPSQRPAPSP